MWHICSCDGLLNPSHNFRKTFHTPEQRTSSTTYRLTAGLNTLESKGDEKGGNRQEEGDIRRNTVRVEVKSCGEKVWRQKGKKECYKKVQ